LRWWRQRNAALFHPAIFTAQRLTGPLSTSRYITVDEDAGRALFYTLVESTSSPESDPLVLWLNGGPGCSSMGGGLMSELGPFYPTPTGEHLIQNDYAWNRVANMLFLDSPAFVGWSYSNRSEDIVVGDKRTAIDSLEFLFGFLDRFPEYRGRTLWLSGESYAGERVRHMSECTGLCPARLWHCNDRHSYVMQVTICPTWR